MICWLYGHDGSGSDRHELRQDIRQAQLASVHLLAPNPQQAAADIMPSRQGRKHRAGRIRLGNNPQLLLKTISPPKCRPGIANQLRRPRPLFGAIAHRMEPCIRGRRAISRVALGILVAVSLLILDC
jgi:hypothetical protein